MDFAGNVFHNPEVEMPTDLPFFNQADLGHPELDEDKWRVPENLLKRRRDRQVQCN
jgi:hypothetical protein